jgi:hypothetical protein
MIVNKCRGISIRRAMSRALLLLALLIVGLARGPMLERAAHATAIATASLVATPSAAPADGTSAIALTGSVYDAAGAGMPGIALRFAAAGNTGVITQPVTTTDSLGQATGSITSTVSGAVAVRLIDAGSGATLAATVVTFVPAPDPARSALTAGPISGGVAASTVPITVTVRDYQGLPLAGRAIRLQSGDAGDRFIQPPPTGGNGIAGGTVTFTGTATIVTAVDVSTGMTLGSITVRSIVAPAPLGIHAILSPAAPRMGNGTDRDAVQLTLLDGANRPLAGKRVALTVSARFADPGGPAITNARGTATFSVGIWAAQRHTGLASGPVALGATDITDGQPLTATARITVYNRVAVMVAGVGTALTCTLQDCHDRIFAQISADALVGLGYNLVGDGEHRTELEYSYRSGAMKRMANGTWQWLITPYAACDTIQPLDRSEAALRAMLQSYRTRYPYTTFELIGHSLGGLIALEGLAYGDGSFVRGLGPAAVDKVITIDAPVNGLSQNVPVAIIGGLAASLYYLRPCRDQLYGAAVFTHVISLGAQAPGVQDRWVKALHAAGVDVLTIANRDDRVVSEPEAIVDDGRAHHASDRARFTVQDGQAGGHGALISRTESGGKPNPAWPAEIRLLQGYLTDPCMPFALPGARCPYPSINIGF